MIEQGSTTLRQTVTTQNMPHDAASMGPGDEPGTMLLDGLGTILSCAEPPGKIFRVRPFKLLGRRISELIVDLPLANA